MIAMAFRETCAFKCFPLIARLVLFAALLPIGWRNLYTSEEFSMSDADRLVSIGVSADGLDWQRIQSTGLGSAEATTTLPQGNAPRVTRALYRDALVASAAGVPYPAIVAWIIAFVEFGGSILLVVGAFTRLSALAIACVIASAFWTTSWTPIRESAWWTISQPDYFRACAQVGLFVLAMNIVLVGSGALSFDEMMGRQPKKSSSGTTANAKSTRRESR